MSFNKRYTRTALLASTSILLASSISGATIAQDAAVEEETAVETITVTGSRIVRKDLSSPSPVTTVGAVELQMSNTVNIESFLNTLPQALPGNDGSSNNPGSGEADVNLRGLGSNRTLVLVNGRRYITSNQNPGVVDLNTIPTALVERVDVVTGGASAVYGSDAIAGVVNFIMKDDFEGIQLDSSYETTDKGDGQIFNAAITVGGNFADGKGNAVMYAQYSRRNSLLQGDRDTSLWTQNDVGDGFSNTGSINVPSGWVYDLGTVDHTAALGLDPANCGATEGAALSGDGTYCTTASFGWLFNDGAADVFINGGENTNRFNYAPDNFLQLPAERFTVASFADYEITDNIRFYTRGIYTAAFVDQLLAPSPVFTTLTINLDNPFLQASGVAALSTSDLLGGIGDADGNGVNDVQVLMGRRMREAGGRLSSGKNDSLQIAAGFDGNIDDNWTYDVYGHFNRGDTFIMQTGNIHVPSYQAVVRENRANIFAADGLTAENVTEIARTGAIRGTTEQTMAAANISGELPITSPMAELPVAVAFGVEWRNEKLDAVPDSVLGPDVAGFNQAPEVHGEFNVKEVFAEASIPLVQGAAFAHEISMTLAGRISDYSTVGSVNSYAAGLSWAPVEDVRLRAQYQRAVRAPNIGELFAPQTNGFPNIADPCSGGSNGGYDGLTAAEQTAANTNCAADGVPAGVVGTPIQVNAQIEGMFGGNPDLVEETSNTFTVGAVISPSAIDGLNITVDYYNISIDGAIANVPSQTIFNECYINANQDFCDQIDRRASGAVDIFRSLALNTAELKVRGVDFTVEYTWDTANLGTFRAAVLGSHNLEASFKGTPDSDITECVGFYADSCGEPTPKWKFNTTLDWSYNDWSVRARWTRMGSVTDATPGSEDFFVPGVSAKNYIDTSFTYQVTESVEVSGGIRNITNTGWVQIGDASAEQSNTYPATYETLGRQFFGGLSLKF